MKKILVILFSILSFSVFAEAEPLMWRDLELYEKYTLTKEIEYENGVKISGGRTFELVDIVAGYGFPYIYFEFYERDCDYKDTVADFGLIPMVDDYGRPYQVMANLQEYCHIGMYVHGSNYYSTGLFQ